MAGGGVPFLVGSARQIINVNYMISAERPEPTDSPADQSRAGEDLLVFLEPGRCVRLRGEEADTIWRQLRRFLLADSGEEAGPARGAAGPTQLEGGFEPGSTVG